MFFDGLPNIVTIKFPPNSNIFTETLCVFLQIKHSSTKWKRSINQNLLLTIHISCLTDTLVPWEVHLEGFHWDDSIVFVKCAKQVLSCSQHSVAWQLLAWAWDENEDNINLPRDCGQTPRTWLISLWKYNLKIEEQHYLFI